MNKQQRELKKSLLLQNIARQRSDLAQTRQDWLEQTQSFDRGWLALTQYPIITATGLGIAAVYGLRHPRKLILWGRRALGVWSTVNFVKNSLNSK
ncbi:YqjK-like family protein [Budviciaceae bacterium BWR-B9]|uniref:YqjK-like family protein n=1 Tax=Limnobaculum allomyrinae TaxID=2791986 RepID=A0ABS1IUB2_9GAMM|nr:MULTISPECIES: YqjK-like family protein [Limnobaculum]MBK5145277.1 YqjK-like family protein [Limnobaculum allomyrinae]MBV7693109.1 YqjK-like family protein [Limnobaculum sp. M2-1]